MKGYPEAISDSAGHIAPPKNHPLHGCVHSRQFICQPSCARVFDLGVGSFGYMPVMETQRCRAARSAFGEIDLLVFILSYSCQPPLAPRKMIYTVKGVRLGIAGTDKSTSRIGVLIVRGRKHIKRGKLVPILSVGSLGLTPASVVTTEV